MFSRMDQQLQIVRATLSKNDLGNLSEVWGPVVSDPNPWGRVELIGSGEEVQGGGKVLVQRARFTLRARADLLPSDRINWDGRAWDIAGRAQGAPRARYMVLEAVSRGVSQ